MSVDMLLNVLQAIAPLKHYSRLREIIGVKLPPGFPVQIGKNFYHLLLVNNITMNQWTANHSNLNESFQMFPSYQQYQQK